MFLIKEKTCIAISLSNYLELFFPLLFNILSRIHSGVVRYSLAALEESWVQWRI